MSFILSCQSEWGTEILTVAFWIKCILLWPVRMMMGQGSWKANLAYYQPLQESIQSPPYSSKTLVLPLKTWQNNVRNSQRLVSSIEHLSKTVHMLLVAIWKRNLGSAQRQVTATPHVCLWHLHAHPQTSHHKCTLYCSDFSVRNLEEISLGEESRKFIVETCKGKNNPRLYIYHKCFQHYVTTILLGRNVWLQPHFN